MAKSSLGDSPEEVRKNVKGCAWGCGGILALGLIIGIATSVLGDDKPRATCLAVSPGVESLIELGLKRDVGKLTLRGTQAVSSVGFPGGYVVGADIQGPGINGDDEIGVWAVSGDIDDVDSVFDVRSLKGYAQSFSTFEEMGFIASIDTGGSSDVRRCVKQKI